MITAMTIAAMESPIAALSNEVRPVSCSCSTDTPIHAATSGSVTSRAGNDVASDPDWKPFWMSKIPTIDKTASA